MSQSAPQYPSGGQPQYGMYPPPPPPPAPKGFAIAALVLGIIGVVIGLFIVFGWLALILGILALIFGIVGLRKKTANGMSITGIILGAIATILGVIGIIVTIAFINAASNALESYRPQLESAMASYSAQANEEHTITYKVTSDVAAKATYTDENGSKTEAVTNEWQKEVTMKGAYIYTSVSVSPDDITTAGNLSCEILIDGKSVSTDSGSSLVSCSGSL
ncbi:DUF4190 domain-containing protein [Haematomicrobium sanguinis]|uniref:DUF4190 domain-containing protein n=1 Tax=Haematomicrobium sanguinis TaxID=479106 RepID=UPI00047B0717|nr:DUF4190 domain-containing protein [Haematomicrobium sanguinis]